MVAAPNAREMREDQIRSRDQSLGSESESPSPRAQDQTRPNKTDPRNEDRRKPCVPASACTLYYLLSSTVHVGKSCLWPQSCAVFGEELVQLTMISIRVGVWVWRGGGKEVEGGRRLFRCFGQ